MKPWFFAGALAATAWAGTLEAQQEQRLFTAAYNAVKVELPAGPHAVVLSNSLLRSCRVEMTPEGPVLLPDKSWDEAAVQQGNREFANANGLAIAQHSKGPVPTVSFHLVSSTADSAVVEVATVYICKSCSVTILDWEAVALYVVELVRRNGEWAVERFGVRAHS